ncbi:MAG: substrate-binding domain-containing protein [Planctomycetes bacterium]|nr:substrate-binding domain-containing protein [Planctomycetota bacterium]
MTAIKYKLFTVFLAAGLPLATGGCGGNDYAGGPAKKKKLCWVQAVKGHPVHQITQIAFSEGCRRLGYEPVIAGTDGPDLAGTIALAEQALAAGEAAGLAVWAGNPSYNSLIEKAGAAGVPVVLPHFPVPEGSAPGARGVISCDPAEYAAEAARRTGQAIAGKGAVAITQGSFNTLENQVAGTFARVLKERCPAVEVLPPREEGFDPPAAISKAVAILQAHPDLTAAFSTTGGGPVTWAGAQRELGRKIIIVGMDYTRVNLDLVKGGEVFAVVGQPLWEESFGAAQLLDRLLRGEKIGWWTKLAAPFITRADLAPHYERLDQVEAALRKS